MPLPFRIYIYDVIDDHGVQGEQLQRKLLCLSFRQSTHKILGYDMKTLSAITEQFTDCDFLDIGIVILLTYAQLLNQVVGVPVQEFITYSVLIKIMAKCNDITKVISYKINRQLKHLILK